MEHSTVNYISRLTTLNSRRRHPVWEEFTLFATSSGVILARTLNELAGLQMQESETGYFASKAVEKLTNFQFISKKFSESKTLPTVDDMSALIGLVSSDVEEAAKGAISGYFLQPFIVFSPSPENNSKEVFEKASRMAVSIFKSFGMAIAHEPDKEKRKRVLQSYRNVMLDFQSAHVSSFDLMTAAWEKDFPQDLRDEAYAAYNLMTALELEDLEPEAKRVFGPGHLAKRASIDATVGSASHNVIMLRVKMDLLLNSEIPAVISPYVTPDFFHVALVPEQNLFSDYSLYRRMHQIAVWLSTQSKLTYLAADPQTIRAEYLELPGKYHTILGFVGTQGDEVHMSWIKLAVDERLKDIRAGGTYAMVEEELNVLMRFLMPSVAEAEQAARKTTEALRLESQSGLQALHSRGDKKVFRDGSREHALFTIGLDKLVLKKVRAGQLRDRYGLNLLHEGVETEDGMYFTLAEFTLAGGTTVPVLFTDMYDSIFLDELSEKSRQWLERIALGYIADIRNKAETKPDPLDTAGRGGGKKFLGRKYALHVLPAGHQPHITDDMDKLVRTHFTPLGLHELNQIFMQVTADPRLLDEVENQNYGYGYGPGLRLLLENLMKRIERKKNQDPSLIYQIGYWDEVAAPPDAPPLAVSCPDAIKTILPTFL